MIIISTTILISLCGPGISCCVTPSTTYYPVFTDSNRSLVVINKGLHLDLQCNDASLQILYFSLFKHHMALIVFQEDKLK